MTAFINPTEAAGRTLVMRGLDKPVTMLNLLRFRAVADYAAAPSFAPSTPISGAAAFQIYVDHTMPFLKESGGELLYMGRGGPWFIGPEAERWDLAMLVRQSSIASFIAFASSQAYAEGLAHRTAAIEDSRLLPMEDA
jgi:uncharacterized protein (DUF1330 family)